LRAELAVSAVKLSNCHVAGAAVRARASGELQLVSSSGTLAHRLQNLCAARTPQRVFVRPLSFSLPSVRWPRITRTPSLEKLGFIAGLESIANANPSDVNHHLALYRSLIQSDHKPSYEQLIGRWERLCRFVAISLPAGSALAHCIILGTQLTPRSLRRTLPALSSRSRQVGKRKVHCTCSTNPRCHPLVPRR
jgi:hypothetical protein